MAELKGNKYGTHRVIEPKGVLTQALRRQRSGIISAKFPRSPRPRKKRSSGEPGIPGASSRCSTASRRMSCFT